MSQKDSEQEEIDGHAYEVFMLKASTGRDMLVDMGKVLGPALGHLVDSGGGLAIALDGEIKFASVAKELIDRLDGKMLDDHMKKLAAVTHVDGRELSKEFERHFQGRIGAMFKWYVFALKVNYRDFSSVLEGVSARLPGATKAKE